MRLTLAMTATTLGGVWRHVADLADGLRDRGHDVRLGLSSHATAPREKAHARELEVCSLIKSIDSRNQIWHLHLHNTYDVQAMGLIAARRPLGAVVTTEHLPHFNGSDRALLGEWGLRTALTADVKTVVKRSSIAACDAVIVPSEQVTEFVRRRYRLGGSTKLHSVPLGVALTPEPLPTSDEPVGTVLASGSIIYQKGFDLLVQAAQRAKAPWRLVILGEGPHLSRLTENVGAALEGRVVLPGWQDDPSPWVREARVICLPSRWETFPYAALEAQMAGRPVVAFAVDGIPEIVEDHVTGVLVEPGNVAGLATALDALATDSGKARQMGLAGRQRAIARFGLAGMIERTEAVYGEVLGDALRLDRRPRLRAAAQVANRRGLARLPHPPSIAETEPSVAPSQPPSRATLDCHCPRAADPNGQENF